MKKRAIIISLLLIVGISYARAEVNLTNDQEVISKAFKESQSKLESFSTNYSGDISDEFLTIKQLDKISQKYIDSLKIKGIKTDLVEENNMSQISIYGQASGGENISLILYSYRSDDNEERTTIFIDISGNDNYMKLEEISSKTTKILEKYGVKAENNSCIVGTYEGKLESEHKMGLVNKLIANTKSEEVESLVDDYLSSYSLYSKQIKSYIYSGKNKMNLNLAINYNEDLDTTYIYIATPIIAVGY